MSVQCVNEAQHRDLFCDWSFGPRFISGDSPLDDDDFVVFSGELRVHQAVDGKGGVNGFRRGEGGDVS